MIKPERVAELLILRADMPRSLHASLNEVVNNLAKVANDQSAETQRRAGKLRPTCSTAASTRSWPPACTPTSRSSSIA